MDTNVIRYVVAHRCKEAVDILSKNKKVKAAAKKYGVNRSCIYASTYGVNMPSAFTIMALTESGLSADYLLGITDKKPEVN